MRQRRLTRSQRLSAAGGARSPYLLLLISALAAILSLGSVLRVYAMPAEARTTEAWYAYQSTVGFDYTARVVPGKFYDRPSAEPDELVRIRLPIEPPTYRRVLVTRFTDAVEVTVPYRFQADRPAKGRVWFRVDGTLVQPGVWQKPYPLVEPQERDLTGTEVAGVETFVIPVKQMLADMEASRTQLGIITEPLEIRIRPVLAVAVEGLREPVRVENSPEFHRVIRSGTVEVEEPREARLEKTLAETRVIPLTVRMGDRELPVGMLRQVSLISLGLFLSLAAGFVWLRRRPPEERDLLQKLGGHLVTVRSFAIPADTAVANVGSARELVQLQALTERPVIEADGVYYLLDGATCYCYRSRDL